jgi:hypothetical protein
MSIPITPRRVSGLRRGVRRNAANGDMQLMGRATVGHLL